MFVCSSTRVRKDTTEQERAIDSNFLLNTIIKEGEVLSCTDERDRVIHACYVKSGKHVTGEAVYKVPRFETTVAAEAYPGGKRESIGDDNPNCRYYTPQREKQRQPIS